MAVLDVAMAGYIAVVGLNRPESRKALKPELGVRLAQTWEELRADSPVRAVMLTGAGDSTFCAGFDLARFIPLISGARQPKTNGISRFKIVVDWFWQATLRDLDLDKLVRGAANRHALAGGMEMLIAGDIRVAATGAHLGLSEVRLGLIPAMGGPARLGRQMPPALASEMLLTGKPTSAECALESGLSHKGTA